MASLQYISINILKMDDQNRKSTQIPLERMMIPTRNSVYICWIVDSIIYHTITCIGEEKIKKEKELGIEAAEREDFQSAIRHFKVAVYYDPKDYKIHEMMSQVYNFLPMLQFLGIFGT